MPLRWLYLQTTMCNLVGVGADLFFMLKTSIGIVPIFYHVKPEDVRCRREVYAARFYHNEKRSGCNPEKLQEWMRVLDGFLHNMGDTVNTKEEDEDRLQLKTIASFALKEFRRVAFMITESDVGSNEVVGDYDIGCTMVCEKAKFKIKGMGGSGKINVINNIISYFDVFVDGQEM